MSPTRRDLLQSAGAVVLGSASGAIGPGTAEAATGEAFSIATTFADFMRGIGGGAEDAGGRVLFTGRDPILNSRFRLGACMAIPAMAGCQLPARSRRRSAPAPPQPNARRRPRGPAGSRNTPARRLPCTSLQTAVTAHRLRDALLISRNDLAQVLRVHARRECCRADEVTEHHRDLTALCRVPWGRLRVGSR